LQEGLCHGGKAHWRRSQIRAGTAHRLVRDGRPRRHHEKIRVQGFQPGFRFYDGAALVAEKMDHHPEWFNVYKTFDVMLSTHDAGGLTDLDVKLAEAMDKIAAG
jgi:4a-hydroxytetrahydrobiopterin dehydratase